MSEVKPVTIVFEIGGGERLAMDWERARSLYEQLHKIFGRKGEAIVRTQPLRWPADFMTPDCERQPLITPLPPFDVTPKIYCGPGGGEVLRDG
jgi:hypothetical protein